LFPSSDQRKGALNQRRSRDPCDRALKNSDWPAPHLGARHRSLLLQFKSRVAQGRNLSGSRLGARASFKLSSWPVCGPVVVPRSVFRLLQFGLVGFPTSLQPSDSIIKGPEGRNHPWSGTCIGASGSFRPASYRQAFRTMRRLWRLGNREDSLLPLAGGVIRPGLLRIAQDRPQGTFQCRVAHGETAMPSA
jgi:hypothetical protein